MKILQKQSGFSFVELMVVLVLISIIGTAGFILFNEGQTISSFALARIDAQNNLRQISQRLALELQESGEDENNALRVTLFDNTGTNNTDIVRFSVPICPCGTLPMDDNGEIKHWGAPLAWGQSGCNSDYPVQNNGKVDICHLPPGNPANEVNIQVNENAVKAHLAHGDRIGDCGSCNPDIYTNQTIEYLMDASGQILRRVLNSGGSVINSVVMARFVKNFQLTFGVNQDSISIIIQVEKPASQNRLVSLSGSLSVPLRNKD